MHNLALDTRRSNGLLSEATTDGIIDTYLRLHGPSTEAELAAVLQAATEAATALACFQMVMRGELTAEVKRGSVVFRKAGEPSSQLEPTRDVLRRLFAEVTL